MAGRHRLLGGRVDPRRVRQALNAGMRRRRHPNDVVLSVLMALVDLPAVDLLFVDPAVAAERLADEHQPHRGDLAQHRRQYARDVRCRRGRVVVPQRPAR